MKSIKESSLQALETGFTAAAHRTAEPFISPHCSGNDANGDCCAAPFNESHILWK
jgi:hypothetical protein